MNKKDIYLKCDVEQTRQLKHFVTLFKEFVHRYNKEGDNGFDIEGLVFRVSNDYWRGGYLIRPNIGYEMPWQSLRLLEELSGIKLKFNPDLDEECRLNDWIELNKDKKARDLQVITWE